MPCKAVRINSKFRGTGYLDIQHNSHSSFTPLRAEKVIHSDRSVDLNGSIRFCIPETWNPHQLYVADSNHGYRWSLIEGSCNAGLLYSKWSQLKVETRMEGGGWPSRLKQEWNEVVGPSQFSIHRAAPRTPAT
jgi:hypothetical protein